MIILIFCLLFLDMFKDLNIYINTYNNGDEIKKSEFQFYFSQ